MDWDTLKTECFQRNDQLAAGLDVGQLVTGSGGVPGTVGPTPSADWLHLYTEAARLAFADVMSDFYETVILDGLDFFAVDCYCVFQSGFCADDQSSLFADQFLVKLKGCVHLGQVVVPLQAAHKRSESC